MQRSRSAPAPSWERSLRGGGQPAVRQRRSAARVVQAASRLAQNPLLRSMQQSHQSPPHPHTARPPHDGRVELDAGMADPISPSPQVWTSRDVSPPRRHGSPLARARAALGDAAAASRRVIRRSEGSPLELARAALGNAAEASRSAAAVLRAPEGVTQPPRAPPFWSATQQQPQQDSQDSLSLVVTPASPPDGSAAAVQHILTCVVPELNSDAAQHRTTADAPARAVTERELEKLGWLPDMCHVPTPRAAPQGAADVRAWAEQRHSVRASQPAAFAEMRPVPEPPAWGVPAAQRQFDPRFDPRFDPPSAPQPHVGFHRPASAPAHFEHVPPSDPLCDLWGPAAAPALHPFDPLAAPGPARGPSRQSDPPPEARSAVRPVPEHPYLPSEQEPGRAGGGAERWAGGDAGLLSQWPAAQQLRSHSDLRHAPTLQQQQQQQQRADAAALPLPLPLLLGGSGSGAKQLSQQRPPGRQDVLLPAGPHSQPLRPLQQPVDTAVGAAWESEWGGAWRALAAGQQQPAPTDALPTGKHTLRAHPSAAQCMQPAERKPLQTLRQNSSDSHIYPKQYQVLSGAAESGYEPLSPGKSVSGGYTSAAGFSEEQREARTDNLMRRIQVLQQSMKRK
eukprot:TRINITY_DN6315_c0_g1_i1.p1 TRINITY_DN6315_c0_g1~~TRINITY_DN6315_c0_g1_i1.p1  ORF type:complete len:622 (+),score=133.50 TRINITY_DN6315_c0_g1_i1:576-2441(+)